MTASGELFDLAGKVAVVTGGSRGIGRAVVLGLAAAGADVVIASRKLDNCEAVAAEVKETTGREALAISFNVGRWDDAVGSSTRCTSGSVTARCWCRTQARRPLTPTS